MPMPKKIREIVRNVRAESKEINYDPEKGTNWCHLPMEMRMRCIEEMDFKTRTHIGATSIFEKSLVRSKKYHFNKIRIISNRNWTHRSWEVTAIKKGTFGEKVALKPEKSTKKKLEFGRFLLETCDIDELHFCDSDRSSDRIDPVTILADCVPFTVKKLYIKDCCWEQKEFFLQNSPNLELAALDVIDSIARFHDIHDVPMLFNVKEIRIADCWRLNNFWKLIQKWIEMDAEVWKSIQFRSHDFPTMDVFAEKFKDRLIQRKRVYARIRMDDPSKQILLRYVGKTFRNHKYFACKVIQMDLPEKDYRKSDTWIESQLQQDERFNRFSGLVNFGYTDQFLRGPERTR